VIQNTSFPLYRPLRGSVSSPEVSMIGGDIIEESITDCPMITPNPSGNPSTVEQRPLNAYQDWRTIIFGDPAMNANANHPPSLSTDFYAASRPSVSLPGVNDILNLPSPSSAFDRASLHHDRTWNYTPEPNNATPRNQNQQIPNPPSPPRSPSSSYTPISSISTCSSNTIRPSSNMQERYYFLVNRFYNTCLDASTSYIRTLRPIPRHRNSPSSHTRSNSARHHPYGLTQSHAPARAPRARQGYNIPGREATLMDNLSVISTHLWRKARSDGMAPHRAEADAVRAMRNLYAWGEILVRGLEEGVYGRQDEEMETESGLSSLGEEEGEVVRVGEAAKRLCEWLRDRRAWGVCERVLKELRKLEEQSEDGLAYSRCARWDGHFI
jgi:hypothetical protein